jgi:hypothetical protein
VIANGHLQHDILGVFVRPNQNAVPWQLFSLALYPKRFRKFINITTICDSAL